MKHVYKAADQAPYKEAVEHKVALEQYEDRVVLKVDGWYVLSIWNDGATTRHRSISPDLGLKLRDDGTIDTETD